MPETQDGWEHLALVVGVPYARIQDGSLTPREIHALACAWHDREKLRAEITAPPSPMDAPAATPPAASHVEPLGKRAAVALRLMRAKPNERQTIAQLCEAGASAGMIEDPKTMRLGLRELHRRGLAEPPRPKTREGWALTPAGVSFPLIPTPAASRDERKDAPAANLPPR